MGFFAPWFLAGAAAVALPIWLHLLRRYRNEPHPFSSLMFFERRVQSSVKHRRLRYLLLFVLRATLLLLLAFAFAKPFLNRTVAAAAQKTLTVIAIDRSFSMRSGDLMDRAKARANRILENLSGGREAQIVALDSRMENLTQPTTERAVLRTAIESIQANDRASSFGEFVRVLRVTEQSTGLQIEAHLISDMQQTSMPPSFTDLQVGPHTSLSLDSIDQTKAANWAVETVTAPARIFDPKRARIVATVSGWQTDAASRKVSLVLDGQVIASKTVDIPKSGRAQVEFLSFNIPYGAHRGEIRMEPHDGLPGDDSYPFAMERSDPRTALFLNDGRPREAFYYKAALDSAEDTGLTLQTGNMQQASHGDFSKYAFVVLGDTGTVNAEMERDLTEYVRRGGSLLISLGPQSIRRGTEPVTQTSIHVSHETQGVGQMDSNHPALRGIGRLNQVQFFETARFEPLAGSRTLIKLADGSPLLVEQSLGEGRILTFASTFDNVANDFPLHTSFLPFVAQTSSYLAGGEDTQSSTTVGTPVMLRRSMEQGTAVDVIGPGGRHELSLHDASSMASYELPAEGFYEVHRANGQRVLVAAHADRRESDLTPVSADTLALWRNTSNRTLAEANPALVQTETRPWGLWRFILLLALAVAFVESMVGIWYLRQERQLS